MQQIGRFTLKNKGEFVSRLEFVYWDCNGNRVHAGGTGDIDPGYAAKADPGAHGVPEGAMVSLYVRVIWGSDPLACQTFEYSRRSRGNANYCISGTGAENDLDFDGITYSC